MAKKKKIRMRDKPMIDRCDGDEEVCAVANHYLSYHPKWRGPKPKELKLIDETLEHYTVHDCKMAIDGLHITDWNIGNNPSGKKYLALYYALHEDKIDGRIQTAQDSLDVTEKRRSRERKAAEEDRKREKARVEMEAVSYTHLTLPTKA